VRSMAFVGEIPKPALNPLSAAKLEPPVVW